MEAIVVIAGIVGLVWGTVVFLRGGLVGGCMAVLLAGACFSLPFLKVELGPLPLTADRALLALLVVQYVLWRRWGLADPKPVGKPEIILVLLVLVLVASAFGHDWQASNYQAVSWLILFYLMPAVVYWIARQMEFGEREALVVFGGFALFGVYLAVTSLAEYYQAWWLVFPKYIETTAAEKTSEFVGRARGPLLQPIGNGVLLAVGLASVLLWWPRLKRFGQLALLATAALLLAAIYFSLTRSVWMGGVLVLAMAVGLALPWNWRAPLLAAGLLVGVLFTATHWDELLAFKRDKSLSAQETAESAELRPILAKIAWNMFLDRPLLGCGYSQYEKESLNYLDDRSTETPLERGRGYVQHNVFLSLLAETGLIGLGLFVTLLGFWTRDAWRLWRDALLPLWARQQGLLLLLALGVYVVNGMFHDVSIIVMMNMTLFFLAGATESLRPLTRKTAALAAG